LIKSLLMVVTFPSFWEHKTYCILQVLNDIELYDQNIDSVPTKDVSRRWPQPPMYCVWDCGQNWDGHEQPVHVALDPEIKSAFVKSLDEWRTR